MLLFSLDDQKQERGGVHTQSSFHSVQGAEPTITTLS